MFDLSHPIENLIITTIPALINTIVHEYQRSPFQINYDITTIYNVSLGQVAAFMLTQQFYLYTNKRGPDLQVNKRPDPVFP